MKIKTGKEEIVYLLTKVIEKYEQTTGHGLTLNTNRKNYEDLARRLSEISNELPNTASLLNHENYPTNQNTEKLEYPYRKYDLTGGQIKDAYSGIVTNPRPFLIDACYIFLYGVGRMGFEENPLDENLLATNQTIPDEMDILKSQVSTYKQEKEQLIIENKRKLIGQRKALFVFSFVSFVLLGITTFKWIAEKNNWRIVKEDMSILPYQPTQAEIDSLVGIWLCYSSSPQAKRSEPNRFHLIIANVVNIKYKDGYFIYNRYGASFNQNGYAQFEAPGLVSIHTHIKNTTGIIESPRHSLMQLNKTSTFLPVISATWSFDVGENNIIIGNREVYTKLGKGGSVEEIINTIENASCKCKIVLWRRTDGTTKTIQLKNQKLNSLTDTVLKKFLDDKSIILRMPQEGLILTTDSIGK